MVSQTPKQQAIFPDLPRNQPVINQDGTMNPYWMLFFDLLVAALQTNYKPEGIAVPQKPSTDIAQLTDATKSTGNIIYDSTTDQFKGNIAGTWKTFTLT
jgi:hypothetical protein